jgi:pSer/pThr/pTyr-binding forkhead associated (FHA) protein
MAASSGDTAWALRFISGKYQGGEFPLKMNRQVTIGRSSELDMVLVEDMVSRKHAKITVGPGKVLIEDLGSTNGTFVNGEKIRQARLKEGDRILIGTSILKLVQREAGAQTDLSAAEMRERLEEAAQVQAAKTNKTSSMTGKIEDIPLPDLLQLFHTSKKNGVLVVTGAHEGRIYLRQGRVYYAVVDGDHALGPQKSFNRIITWEEGTSSCSPDGHEFMVELDRSTEALLMDALRLLDEYKRIEAQLPLPRPRSCSADPWCPGSGPHARAADLLQLVHNHGTLRAVMDHSEADDVTIAEAIVELIRKDYVRAG